MDDIKRAARRALVYPALVIGATLTLVTLLFAHVIPRFAEIFDDLRLPLPNLTVAVIQTGRVFQSTWPWALGVGALGILAIAWARRLPRLRRIIDRLLLRLPLIGLTARLLIVARFAAHLRLLHDAGIPLLDALDVGARLVGNAAFHSELSAARAARAAVARGRPLAQELLTGSCFPSFVGLCLKAGDLSGQLGRARAHIAEHATREARERIACALLLLEPVLLVV